MNTGPTGERAPGWTPGPEDAASGRGVCRKGLGARGRLGGARTLRARTRVEGRWDLGDARDWMTAAGSGHWGLVWPLGVYAAVTPGEGVCPAVGKEALG